MSGAMRLDKTYVAFAELDDGSHEEYGLELPASSQEMAEKAAEAACGVLGLKVMAVTEKDWK